MMNESGFPPSSSSNYSTTFHLDHYDPTTFLTDVLEMESDAINHELGFMDLLSIPPTSSILHHQPLSSTSNQDQFFNAPPTPNSSSISSQDPQPRPQDDDVDGDDDDQLQNTSSSNKQRLKVVKKGGGIQKRKREPRFAFMTKSEVDHLEDGYRWRKYGQKAVKNSAFPRSYYRCTSTSCNVKKRVERCWNDPTIVVTTYEGQHTHPTPIMHRSPSWPPTLDQLLPIPQAHLKPQQLQLQLQLHHHGLLQDLLPSSLVGVIKNNKEPQLM